MEGQSCPTPLRRLPNTTAQKRAAPALRSLFTATADLDVLEGVDVYVGLQRPRQERFPVTSHGTQPQPEARSHISI